MNRCPVCGAPIRYGGQMRYAYDVAWEPHVCALPALPRVLLCVCGQVVLGSSPDRTNFDDGSPHSCTPPEVPIVATDAVPPPSDSDQPPAPQQLRSPPMRVPSRPSQFTGGVDTSLAD